MSEQFSDFEFSEFGERLCMGSGIEELMDDLGNALAHGGPDTRMLGGGQPAHIPEVNALWRRRIEEILATPGGMEKMLSNYDPPRGNPMFLDAIAKLFQESFGWDITAKNVAITSGGQTAFFSCSMPWLENLKTLTVKWCAKRFSCHWCQNILVTRTSQWARTCSAPANH